MQSRLDKKLQQRSLRLIRRICEARGIIPSSYILQGVHIHFGEIQYHGGFSDVSNGEYQGCIVAIKHLRTNKRGLNEIFKVFFDQRRRSPLFTFLPAVLPRGYRLETFIPSEHSTPARGLHLRQHTSLPHSY